jgi:hypothetical protein
MSVTQNFSNYILTPTSGLVLFINADDGQLYVKDQTGAVYLFSSIFAGGGGSVLWGQIDGNIYAQPDLQVEFNTKTNVLEESVTCNVSTGVGGIALNQTFASGTSFTEFVNSLIVTSNSATLNITVSGSSAVYAVNQSSTTTNVTVFGTYASGTDGALSNYNIIRTTNGAGVEVFNNSTPPIIPPAGTSVALGRGVTGYITLQAFAVNATATRNSNTRAFTVIFPYYAGYLTPDSGNTAPTTAQIATFINTGSVSGYTGALVNNATLSAVSANVAINFSSSVSTPNGFLFVCLPQITLNSSNAVTTTPAKTSWFDTAQPAITESIGGGGTGLFPNARATQSITSSGGTFTTNYDVYISGYQSKSSPITFKN